MQLVVGQPLQLAARGAQRIVEDIPRPVHAVHLHHRPQATLVEHGVVGHQRQPLDERFYLVPYRWEHLGAVGVLVAEPMHPLAEPGAVVRIRLYEAVERIHHLAPAHHDHPHAAHAAPLPVGRLKVYGCKVLHTTFILVCFSLQRYELFLILCKLNYAN